MKTADRTRIIDHLHILGCNDREAELYLQALTLGPSTVQELARHVRRNRVTVHSAAQQLIEKGLFFETRRGKRRLLVAEEPMGLLRLLKKKEEEWNRARQNMEHIIPLLTGLQTADVSVPTVKLYEDVDGLKRMLEETLTAKDEVLVFTYVDLFSQLLEPAYLERYYARRAAKGIPARLIFPTGPFAERTIPHAKEHRMEIRTLPPPAAWKSGIFCWNDTLAIQSFTEGRVTCTLIENRDIAHFFRAIIFPLCWAQAKPAA